MTVTGFFALRRARLAGWATLLALAGTLASAQQQPNQRITPNFKDADIVQIAEAVGAATGKNFILDPRVRAQVTMLSSTPMSPDAFYQAFLSILQVHSFVAMPAGNVVKIVPDASARTMPGDDLPNRVSGTSDEIVTQVIQVKNVNAAQLVPILRSLIPQNGHLAAYQPSNILIISDRAANVNRIQRIIQRIDQAGDSDVEIIPLQNASAGRSRSHHHHAVPAAAGAGRRLEPDEARGGRPLEQRARERRPDSAPAGEDTHRASGYAAAEWRPDPGALPAIRGRREDRSEAERADHRPGAGCRRRWCSGWRARRRRPSPAALADKATPWSGPSRRPTRWSSPLQPSTMRQINAIIDKLDIRRMQVLVEAIIVEVGADKTSALGVNWAVFSNEDDTRVPLGGFIQPVGGTSIVDLAQIAAESGCGHDDRHQRSDRLHVRHRPHRARPA